jgi:hypothetical protein
MSRFLTFVLVLSATTALASKHRVAVIAFEGASGPEVELQLKKLLCKSFQCVKPGKAKDVSVDAVVTGQVEGNTLTLKVYTDEGAQPVTKEIAVPKNRKLGKGAFAAAVAVRQAIKAAAEGSDEVAGALGAGSP